MLRPLMKVVNGANADQQELMERATSVIHTSIEERMDQTTYIKAYGRLQDEVREARWGEA